MITLKTLPQATAQEVFNQVAKHLLTQNAQSLLSDGSCAYRGKGGLKCAAGCLIDDNEYNEIFEGKSWRSLMVNGWVPEDHYPLIIELQRIHDDHEPEGYKAALKRCATDFNLEFQD